MYIITKSQVSFAAIEACQMLKNYILNVGPANIILWNNCLQTIFIKSIFSIVITNSKTEHINEIMPTSPVLFSFIMVFEIEKF